MSTIAINDYLQQTGDIICLLNLRKVLMSTAATFGHIEIVKLCKGWGITNFNEALCNAACGGQVEIVKLCKEWGATDYDDAMCDAAYNGHIEVVKLRKVYGATDFNQGHAGCGAAEDGHRNYRAIKRLDE